jgi:hypothetical protein
MNSFTGTFPGTDLGWICASSSTFGKASAEWQPHAVGSVGDRSADSPSPPPGGRVLRWAPASAGAELGLPAAAAGAATGDDRVPSGTAGNARKWWRTKWIHWSEEWRREMDQERRQCAQRAQGRDLPNE